MTDDAPVSKGGAGKSDKPSPAKLAVVGVLLVLGLVAILNAMGVFESAKPAPTIPPEAAAAAAELGKRAGDAATVAPDPPNPPPRGSGRLAH